MTKTIVVGNKHFVNTGLLQTIAISIDGQNGVDAFQFVPPDLDGVWVWRVETEQSGNKKYHLLDETLLWTIGYGDVKEGDIKIQLVGLQGSGEDTLIWKSRIFDGRVLPAINASEAVEPGDISDFDKIAAQVQQNAQTASDAAQRAETSAETAKQYVDSITVDVEAVADAAEKAKASADTAAQSEVNALKSANVAKDNADASLTNANNAATSEANAAKSASDARTSATQASEAATRAEDAAAGAENIVNTAIGDIEAEGQKQAAAIASSGTQALEAIGQVEQTAITQVRAAGTTQVGAVEDAGDSKLAEINAATTAADTAAANAENKAALADAAAQSADTAADNADNKATAAEAAAAAANAAANRLSAVELDVTMLPPSAEPAASVEQTETKTTFSLGIPTSNLAYSTFEVDATMELLMHSPDGFDDISFALRDGELEVSV